jgi:hypothetical protein
MTEFTHPETRSMYREIVAAGDDPQAPQRVCVDNRGDRALVTLAEPERQRALRPHWCGNCDTHSTPLTLTPTYGPSCSPAPTRGSAPEATCR